MAVTKTAAAKSLAPLVEWFMRNNLPACFAKPAFLATRVKEAICLLALFSGMQFYFCEAATAQVLPRGAVIIEQRTLPSAPDRALILWMLKPNRSEPIPEDDQYMCPDETRGNAYHGPTRVSLISISKQRIINTIQIRDPHFPRKDGFDIPYEIRPGYYYRVDSTDANKASKPTILNFQDLNGDGEAEEFVLYDAPFCMGLQTTLVGYSKRQDRVIQYPLEIEFRREKKRWREKTSWLEYIFSKKAVAPGHYTFTVDYRGRGGSLVAYDVAYNRALERFRGTCVVTD
jgi:hypothetical protein